MKKINRTQNPYNPVIKSLLIAFMVGICFSSKSQEKLNIQRLTPEETFDYLKTFALENEYFILNMDSKGHWIQVKWNYKSNKIFKNIRKYRINFFVNGNKNQGSSITIQMNEEILRNSYSDGPYYEDEGVIQEGKDHELLMQRLQAFFDDIRI